MGCSASGCYGLPAGCGDVTEQLGCLGQWVVPEMAGLETVPEESCDKEQKIIKRLKEPFESTVQVHWCHSCCLESK